MVTLVAEPVLTVTEFAKEFRVSGASVRMWCAQGVVRCFKLPGGNWRIPASEVTRLRNGLTVEVGSE